MTSLAIANVGGHLRQLVELVPRLDLPEPVLWVTNDTPQSRSLLEDEKVLFLRYPRARSLGDAWHNTRTARRAIGTMRIDAAVSTGASLAVSVLPIVARRGGAVHYIESATRIDGPSTSGRLLRWLPGINLYSQSPRWADDRWLYRGDVFDGFEAHHVGPRPIRRIVVTVGTSTYAGFRRLIERLLAIIPEDVEVLWQTGITDVADLPIDATPSLPSTELEDAIRAADVVVAHAGTGSALTALALGAYPILVPRDPQHGEHVDAHQFQTAERLHGAKLASTPRVEHLTYETLQAAAEMRVRSQAAAADFELVGRSR
jgi:UDP-N-acetylglucosamine--N-acetylmuramyl-(pentapeptide) pyrophosphoryl-undecaprenol N-acetylglucosamine transferase